MNRTNKIMIPIMAICLMLPMLSGCKADKETEAETKLQIEASETGQISSEVAEKASDKEESTSEMEEGASESEVDASFLVNEGDVEIIVPDDQEMGGE